MSTPTARWLSVLVSCMLVLWACGGDDDDSTATKNATRTTSAAATTTKATAPSTTTAPSADTSTTQSQSDALATEVSRDTQAAAIALDCDFCDRYESYQWLVQNRGYPLLTNSEIDSRTRAVCSMSTAERDADRVNIALLYLDAGSDKEQYCK